MTATVDAEVLPDGAPDDALPPGYVAVAQLSRGHRLDTYAAYSVERDCSCVVKTVRPDRRDEPEVVEALRQEGGLLLELTHPNLVRAYEVVEQPFTAVVLETLGGAMLSAAIEDGPLDVDDAVMLGRQLASGLGYLHRHGWLHLDVKPSNIAVTGGQAKLIDLSLAGRPGAGRRGAGTPGYLAPEQASGGGLSAATDVFGVGITLGESLTGRLAHGEESRWRSSRARSARPRRRFARRLRRHPPTLAELVLACVEPDPADRPSLVDVGRTLGELSVNS